MGNHGGEFAQRCQAAYTLLFLFQEFFVGHIAHVMDHPQEVAYLTRQGVGIGLKDPV
jgi:hypothetical protein